jgi:hypothetical protein
MKTKFTEKSSTKLNVFPVLVKHQDSGRVVLMLNEQYGIAVVNTENNLWCDTPAGCIVDITLQHDEIKKNIYGIGYKSYEAFRKHFIEVHGNVELEF